MGDVEYLTAYRLVLVSFWKCHAEVTGWGLPELGLPVILKAINRTRGGTGWKSKISCYVVFGDFIAFNKESMFIFLATHKKKYIPSVPEALTKQQRLLGFYFLSTDLKAFFSNPRNIIIKNVGTRKCSGFLGRPFNFHRIPVYPLVHLYPNLLHPYTLTLYKFRQL